VTSTPESAEDRQRVIASLVQGYLDGQSIRALATASGRSYGFVQSALRQAGVAMRPRGIATNAAPAVVTPAAASGPVVAPPAAVSPVTDVAVGGFVAAQEPADQKKTTTKDETVTKGKAKKATKKSGKKSDKKAAKKSGKKAAKKSIAKKAKPKKSAKKSVKKSGKKKSGKSGKKSKKK